MSVREVTAVLVWNGSDKLRRDTFVDLRDRAALGALFTDMVSEVSSGGSRRIESYELRIYKRGGGSGRLSRVFIEPSGELRVA